MADAILPGIPDVSEKNILFVLQALKEIIETREGLRGEDLVKNRLQTLNRLKIAEVDCRRIRPENGWTGILDLLGRRVTIEYGVITNVVERSSIITHAGAVVVADGDVIYN